MDRKTFKDATLTDQGQVQAVFATLNVKDLDGDVTLPGAFEVGAEVPISAYGHGSWSTGLPVGRGVINVEGEKAMLNGQFFMDTQHGRDTFLTVKGLASLGQWSYGYDVIDAETGQFNGEQVRFLKKQHVHEVSPVLIGAGIGTVTVGTKSVAEEIEELEAAIVELKAGRLSASTRSTLSTIHDGLAAVHGTLGGMRDMVSGMRDQVAPMLDAGSSDGGDDSAKSESVRAALVAEAARYIHITQRKEGDSAYAG